MPWDYLEAKQGVWHEKIMVGLWSSETGSCNWEHRSCAVLHLYQDITIGKQQQQMPIIFDSSTFPTQKEGSKNLSGGRQRHLLTCAHLHTPTYVHIHVHSQGNFLECFPRRFFPQQSKGKWRIEIFIFIFLNFLFQSSCSFRYGDWKKNTLLTWNSAYARLSSSQLCCRHRHIASLDCCND